MKRHVHIILLLFVEFTCFEKFEQTENAIHGRPNFVAHISKKLRLSAACILCILFGRFQVIYQAHNRSGNTDRKNDGGNKNKCNSKRHHYGARSNHKVDGADRPCLVFPRDTDINISQFSLSLDHPGSVSLRSSGNAPGLQPPL